MLKLPSTTEYVRVRRYRLVATPDLVQKHENNLKPLVYVPMHKERDKGQK